jgi:MFS family permease
MAKGLKIPVYASLSMAFALMGDAFLYSFLPVNGASVQVPLVWIGILLSINRFVRIIANPLILYLFRWVGFRRLSILATLLAIVSTAGYGLGLGITGWLVLRVAWGIAFAVLRISSLTYAMDHPRQGFALGISRSIQELGPLFALVAGPWILGHSSPGLTFGMLAVFSLPALYFALHLPERPGIHPAPMRSTLKLPSLLNGMGFLTAFSVEGLLLMLLGALLIQSHPDWTPIFVISVVASGLTLRRISATLLAPLGGWLADRYGLTTIFSYSWGSVIGGMLLLASGWTLLGTVLIFTLGNIQSSLAAVTGAAGRKDVTRSVAENATWRDAGAALGALTGGWLLTAHWVRIPFFLMGVLLFLGLIKYLTRWCLDKKIRLYANNHNRFVPRWCTGRCSCPIVHGTASEPAAVYTQQN